MGVLVDFLKQQLLKQSTNEYGEPIRPDPYRRGSEKELVRSKVSGVSDFVNKVGNTARDDLNKNITGPFLEYNLGNTVSTSSVDWRQKEFDYDRIRTEAQIKKNRAEELRTIAKDEKGEDILAPLAPMAIDPYTKKVIKPGKSDNVGPSPFHYFGQDMFPEKYKADSTIGSHTIPDSSPLRKEEMRAQGQKVFDSVKKLPKKALDEFIKGQYWSRDKKPSSAAKKARSLHEVELRKAVKEGDLDTFNKLIYHEMEGVKRLPFDKRNKPQNKAKDADFSKWVTKI